MSATINETLHLPKTGNAIRLSIGVILGVCITAGLFWFMQYLIVTADRELNEGDSTNLIDFVRLKRDESIQRRQLKPKKPPPPDAPPPQPPTPQLENLNPNAEKIAISAAPVGPPGGRPKPPRMSGTTVARFSSECPGLENYWPR